ADQPIVYLRRHDVIGRDLDGGVCNIRFVIRSGGGVAEDVGFRMGVAINGEHVNFASPFTVFRTERDVAALARDRRVVVGVGQFVTEAQIKFVVPPGKGIVHVLVRGLNAAYGFGLVGPFTEFVDFGGGAHVEIRLSVIPVSKNQMLQTFVDENSVFRTVRRVQAGLAGFDGVLRGFLFIAGGVIA